MHAWLLIWMFVCTSPPDYKAFSKKNQQQHFLVLSWSENFFSIHVQATKNTLEHNALFFNQMLWILFFHFLFLCGYY